jgi:hypothetical protein
MVVAAALLAAAAASCKGATVPAGDAVSAAPAAGDAAPSGPKAQIACDAPEFDFGTVAQGEEAKHVFVMKNAGDAPLKIESARGG